jgi:hypothetical protein
MVLERGTPKIDARPLHVRYTGGLVALAAGAVSLVAAFLMVFTGQHEVTTLPNPWVTVPLLAVAVAGTVAALLRREPHRAPAIIGLGMASAAVALGWVVVAAAVATGAVLISLIVAKLM